MTEERRDLLLVLLLALALQGAYMWFSAGDYLYPDSDTYLAPARGMLHGYGFAAEEGVAETLRTPGYPLFLLPFLASRSSAATIVLAQHVLSALVIAAVFLFVRQRLGSRRAAFAASAVMLFDTITVHYANKVLSETLFTAGLFALFLMLLAIVHARHAVSIALLAGIASGVLVLIRPVAVLLFACVLVYLALQGTSRRTLAVYTCTALVLPFGWALRNRRETGVFTVASVAGTNMLLHRGAAAVAMDDEGPFEQRLPVRQAEALRDAEQIVIRQQKVTSIDDVPHAIAARVYGRIGARLALAHPRGSLLVALRGIAIDLFASDWEAVSIVSRIPSATLRVAITALNAAVIACALAGLATLLRHDRAVALLLGVIIFYFVSMSSGSEAEARFRVPVVPELAIAASAVFVRRNQAG